MQSHSEIEIPQKGKNVTVSELDKLFVKMNHFNGIL